jgi:phosphoribosylaminoimidazolecarboxamide formyltransferase/IMP cyclohydrolase
MIRVRRALLSVSDKAGLIEFARGLADLSVEPVVHGRHRARCGMLA